MTIKAIVFDLWGVTLKQRSLVSHFLYPLVKDFISMEELKQRYGAACVADLTEAQVWQGIPQPEKIKAEMLSTISLNQGSQVFNRLRNQFKVVLFSRCLRAWGEPISQKLKLDSYFDEIIFTSDLRLDKSNPESFKKIQTNLGLKPEEIIFIDDKLANLVSAKQAGWQTVWLENQAYPPSDFKPDFSIKSLGEIEGLVQSLNA